MKLKPFSQLQKRVNSIALFFCIFSILVACTGGGQEKSALLSFTWLEKLSPAWAAIWFSKPVLVVNEHKLSAVEFSEKLSRKARQYDALTVKNPAILKRLKDDICRDFIVDQLTTAWASKAQITVTDAEADQEVENLRKKYPDDNSLRRLLAQEGMTLEDWSDSLKKQLLKQKVLHAISKNINDPSDAELKTYYDEHREHYSYPERAHLRQIVLSRESDAERIHAKLKANGDFKELAKQFSSAPEAEQYGDLGWIEINVLDVFNQAFKLRPGQRTEIIKSDFGFHIIELIAKEAPKTLSFEQAKASIRTQLLSSKEQMLFTKWLEEQTRTAKVFKDDKIIDALRVETKSF